MMKTIKETLELALESLITINNAIYVNSQQESDAFYKASDAITALKEALTSVPNWASEAIEQPSGEATLAPVAKPHEQEPVAVVSGYYGGQCVILPIDPARIFNSNTALYTSPPQREPLTDEQIWREYRFLWPFHPEEERKLASDILMFARAIEAVLKAKNSL